MRRFSTFFNNIQLFLILSLFLTAQSVLAISLDEFKGDPNSQSVMASGTGGTASDVTPDVSAIGGTRSVELASTSNGIIDFFAGTVNAQAEIAYMSHSQSSSSTGSSLIVYDGDLLVGLTDEAGLGGLDFTEDSGTAIRLLIRKFDYPSNQPLDITIIVYDAGDPLGQTYSIATITLNQSLSNHIESLDFANLGGFAASGPGGHTDFTNVGAISIFIDGVNESNDLEINLLGTDGQCTHVPINGLIKDECGECNGPGTDTDKDGTADCNDECVNDPDKILVGICGCGVADTDTDKDNTADCNDGCINDPDKVSAGVCGCGIADTDSDKDNVADCNDGCVNDPDKTDPGICGCGVADTDSDGDNIPDCNDQCIDDPDKTIPGVCGCGIADVDTDKDNIFDCNDQCIDDPDKTDPGVCGCGVADTDSDGDNISDCNDQCVNDPNKTAPGICGCGVTDSDSDNDQVADCNDQCVNDPLKITPGICGCGEVDVDADGDGTPACLDQCEANDQITEPGECGCDTSITKDRCGICGGDGNSCLDCQDFDITTTQHVLDNGAKDQEKQVNRMNRKLKRISRTKKTKAFIATTNERAHELQISNWILSWEIPSVFSTCQNTFCVSVSNEPQLSTYRNQSEEIRILGDDVATKIKRELKKQGKRRSKLIKRFRAQNNALHDKNIETAATVPEVASSCS